jgi:hypothetical protein
VGFGPPFLFNHTLKTMNKTWKGKKTDFILVMLYFLIFALVAHTGSSIKSALKHHENIWDELFSFPHFLLVLCIFIVFLSPVWIYFRKIPRSVSIDPASNKFSIDKRKKKSFNLNLDAISCFQRTFQFSWKFMLSLKVHADS